MTHPTSQDVPLLRGLLWRIGGWLIVLLLLGSIGYATVLMISALLDSRIL